MATIFSPPADSFSNYKESDTSLNNTWTSNKFDTQSSIVSDLLGGAVASVVDIGASLWNSVPFTEEVQTSDLLSRISENALRVYEENPEAVQTASLIGGAFIPGGIAVKGMNALRNGSKAVNWFSAIGKEKSLAEVAELVAQGKKGTDAYKTAIRSLYTRGIANEVLDAAAAEVAILGTFNAHPLMEDYLDDPVKNFGLSLAFGGVLGSAVGHVADRFAIKSMAGALEDTAQTNVFGALKNVKSDMNIGTALEVQQNNIETLTKILNDGKAAGNTAENSMEMQIAQRALFSERGQQATLFEEALDSGMKGWSKEAKQELLDKIASNTSFWHVDGMRELTEKQAVGKGFSVKEGRSGISNEPTLQTKNKQGEIVEREAVYDPVHNVFLPKGEAPSYVSAATLSSKPEYHEGKLPWNYGKVANKDWDLEAIGRSAPEVQSEFIGSFLKLSKYSPEQLKGLELAENDIAGLTSVLSRMSKDMGSMKTKVRVASTAPKKEEIFNTQLTQQFTPDGRPIRYADEVKKIATPQGFAKFDLYGNRSAMELGRAGEAAINGWVAGEGETIRALRRGASDFFAKGFAAVKSADERTIEYRTFENIYNSTPSIALREHMRSIADKDGNVLLYRGWKTDPTQVRGQATLTSYALEPSKAMQFSKESGGVGLYRVHVDDIVAGVNDIGGGASHAEIIVHAGARPVEATLDRQGRARFFNGGPQTVVAPKNISSPELSYGELQEKLITAKENLINAMFQAGTPVITIALKTNTPVNTVIALRGASHSLDELVNVKGMRLNTISNADEAAAALADTNKAFIVSGNVQKNPYAAAKGNMDRKLLDEANALITESVLRSSTNPALKQLADELFITNKKSLDILRAQLGAVNNSYAGNRFLESFDSYSRNMKDVGVVANHVGKTVEKISQTEVDRIVSPLSVSIRPIVNDPAAITEMNIFQNIHQSIPGRRVYANRQLWQEVDAVGTNGKPIKTLEPVKFQGKEFTVQSDSVDKLLTEMQAMAPDLLSLANANRKLVGKAPINDIGFWMPATNPVNKAIAYVHDVRTDGVSMLLANTTKELEELMAKYQSHLIASGNDKNVFIVPKSQQEYWSKLNSRNDAITMENAELGMQKTGSLAQPIIKPTADIFSDLVGGYQHYVTAQIRNIADASMSDVTSGLRRMSERNQYFFEKQPFTKADKARQQPEDAARTVLNTLLGHNNLGEYKGWESVNTSFENVLAISSQKMGEVWNTFVQPVKKTFFSKGKELDASKMGKLDYKQYTEMLEEKGIPNPFAVFDKAAADIYGVAKLEDAKDISKRLVYGGNALAATMLLRFGDMAQPLVNMLSLPILTSLAAASKMPETFLGVAKGTANVGVVQIMHEGIRAMNSPIYKQLDKKWLDKGYYKPVVSEASETLRATRSFEKGAIAKVENAIDSNIVKIMSTPADWAEAQARRSTMFTGYILAKKLYPELDEAGATIFARDFLDRSIGNFHASQRPVLFQGTLGVALGLFQTYMVTLAQGVYRNLEAKNYKALGKAALAQSTIFGASSMPGFGLVSQTIGEHYSDDHIDLETGTFRALPDDAARMILYGLPSNLTGSGLNTRGDVSFRPPNIVTGGAQSIVAVNFVQQAFESLSRFKQALSVDSEDMGTAFAQALSLQSMSRPIARMAELGLGYSVTQDGNTVQIPEEVMTPAGIFARLLSTRPLQEVQLRNAMHLNSYYGSVDTEARKKVTGELKTAIRSGNLSDEKLSALAEAYMEKNGTAAGWRAAVNEALGRTTTEGNEYVANKLKPDSPLQWMINSLD